VITRILLTVVVLWALVMAIWFVLSITVPIWPQWLELPWSGFDDFAVTPDGSVVVYTSFFHRLLVYNLDGDFRWSLPCYRARGRHELATDVKGRVYVRNWSTVYVAETLAPVGFRFHRHSVPIETERGWKLDPAGELQPAGREGLQRPVRDRAARGGEPLFGAERRFRTRFTLESGGWVERVHDRLVVHPSVGQGKTIGTPWYLYWAKFPFPGALAWIAAFGLGLAERWRIHHGSANSGYEVVKQD
jgi:hypothetical protein